MNASTHYLGNKRFESGEGLARVVMDAKPKAGGAGEAPTPKMLVLQGLLGCTGLDVVSILERKEVRFEGFYLEAEASQTKKAPQVFDMIELTFHIKADPSERKQVEKAIKMSQEWFCGVSEMLRKTAEISWELDLQPLE